MNRTIWLNGAFVAEQDAQISIFDRGLLFADAVYEGFGVLNGKINDFAYHMARLRRSLAELKIAQPMHETELHAVLTELIQRNQQQECFLYLHITRGEHDRDYLYPDNLKPNMFAFTQPLHGGLAAQAAVPMTLASSRDLRWARRDIKTSNLLGQVLAKQHAREQGADEALMVDPAGYVTEAGAMSFFIIKDQQIFARPLQQELLPGVTRRTMLEVAAELDLSIINERFTLADVYDADEAFVTGASSYVQPVSSVDGHMIGKPTGKDMMGPITARLREAYLLAIRHKVNSI
jgi:D-alanine transaminase